MRRYLFIYVALTVVIPVFGQAANEEPKAQSTVEQNSDGSPAPVRPKRRAQPPAYSFMRGTVPGSYRPTQKRPLAAQYSPLAAAGGYARPGVTPWQAIVNYFNPHHLDMGQLFAERKQAWLDNAFYNQYFWYSFWVTGLLILSWFVIAWIHNDRVRATWELAECASDALRYSEYCKREAKEAIRRHNDHIEKCNRIIEDRRSGLMTTPETANLQSFKQELQKLRADNESLRSENTQLQEQLDGKTAEFQKLTERVTEAERSIQAKQAQSPNAELVDRIQRLELRNSQLEQKVQSGNGKDRHARGAEKQC